MNGFLEKLERAAERWMHILDSQLQDTTVQTITGQVFTHDVSVKATVPQEDAVPHDVTLAPHLARESHKPEADLYPPVLKKAHASHK